MASARIAVIGGDGIGPEVIEQAIRVTDRALQAEGVTYTWNRLPWSSAFYKETGNIVPKDGWEQLRGMMLSFWERWAGRTCRKP